MIFLTKGNIFSLYVCTYKSLVLSRCHIAKTEKILLHLFGHEYDAQCVNQIMTNISR